MAGLLDALGKGLAYNAPSAIKDRDDQRELDNYEKKLRLAQKLQEEMDARKRELGQQYPEIVKTINTPTGVTLGVYSDNSTKELYRDEDYRAAMIGNKMAPAIRAENDTTLTPHKAGLLDAKTNAANVGAEQAPIRTQAIVDRVAKSNEPKPDKELSPTAGRTSIAAMNKALLEEIGGYEGTRAGKLKKLSPEDRKALEAKIISRNPKLWTDYLEAMGQAVAPSVEAASPAAPSTNPFMKR